MKRLQVLGDLSDVLKALDTVDRDDLTKSGVNEILNIHLKILKHQQKELYNMTKELNVVKKENRCRRVRPISDSQNVVMIFQNFPLLKSKFCITFLFHFYNEEMIKTLLNTFVNVCSV